MKSLKNKLIVSVVMLLIAAIMMGVSSFAWFTISTNPEITGATAQVVVNENLEIALRDSATAPGVPAVGDTTDVFTYGNLVNFDGTTKTETGYDDLETVLRPATLTGGTFQYPTYGNDGRVNTLANLVEVPENGTAFGYLKDSNTDAGKIYGYYMKYWVRTNVAGYLQISDAAKRSTAGVMGAGSYFQADGTGDKAETLAANIAVAYKLGTGTITKLADSCEEGATKKLFAPGTTIGSLTADTDTELTIYVYLEGATVYNAAASVGGTVVKGTLNLQFQNSAISVGSMDGQE